VRGAVDGVVRGAVDVQSSWSMAMLLEDVNKKNVLCFGLLTFSTLVTTYPHMTGVELIVVTILFTMASVVAFSRSRRTHVSQFSSRELESMSTEEWLNLLWLPLNYEDDGYFKG
jgi:hypothetical protein